MKMIFFCLGSFLAIDELVLLCLFLSQPLPLSPFYDIIVKENLSVVRKDTTCCICLKFCGSISSKNSQFHSTVKSCRTVRDKFTARSNSISIFEFSEERKNHLPQQAMLEVVVTYIFRRMKKSLTLEFFCMVPYFCAQCTATPAGQKRMVHLKKKVLHGWTLQVVPISFVLHANQQPFNFQGCQSLFCCFFGLNIILRVYVKRLLQDLSCNAPSLQSRK